MILILGEQITNIEGWAADRASELMRKHNGRKGRREEGKRQSTNRSGGFFDFSVRSRHVEVGMLK